MQIRTVTCHLDYSSLCIKVSKYSCASHSFSRATSSLCCGLLSPGQALKREHIKNTRTTNLAVSSFVVFAISVNF